jgi:hypothetical protein
LVLAIFLEQVFHTDYDKQAFGQEKIDALFCHAVGNVLSFLRSKGRWECNPDVHVFVFVACESNSHARHQNSVSLLLTGIPPARIFVGHGGHGGLLNGGHLLLGKWRDECLSSSKGGILLGGETESQERHVWIAGKGIVQTLRH